MLFKKMIAIYQICLISHVVFMVHHQINFYCFKEVSLKKLLCCVGEEYNSISWCYQLI